VDNNEIKEFLDEKRAVQHILRSENGQKLMAMMERECNPPKLMGSTHDDTIYNVGKRDAYTYMEEIRDCEIPDFEQYLKLSEEE